MAQPGQNYVPLFPFVIVWNLKMKHKNAQNALKISYIKIINFKCIIYLSNCSMVAVGVEGDATRVPPVGHNPANPHHKVPVDEAIVGTPQHVPRDWDALRQSIEWRFCIHHFD
jgi:hypothetical protein